jgi:hypothetical protein
MIRGLLRASEYKHLSICGDWFSVLGGTFAEAIDLPGERLAGAFMATLGLPQVNSVNEQMRNRMNAAFGQGYNYAYLFPGIRKVTQAAGRVIRTQLDQGVVYLIDDRFSCPEVSDCCRTGEEWSNYHKKRRIAPPLFGNDKTRRNSASVHRFIYASDPRFHFLTLSVPTGATGIILSFCRCPGVM